MQNLTTLQLHLHHIHLTPSPKLLTPNYNKIITSGNSKSCALDPLPTSLLKSLLPVLLPTIRLIVNKSLSNHYMPIALREAVVKPLIKKPSLDKENLKNFRPVSNLPYLGKLIEQVDSTETALIKVTNDILRALDNRQCVYLVLLDLSAAFDTIDHQVFPN